MFMTLCLVLAGCSNGNSERKNDSNSEKNDKKQELHISAAASLTDTTKELKRAFEANHKDANVTFNYGGSGSLRQQIEKGAPVDVFMSANKKDVDALQDKAQNTYEYAKNKLVLIGAKDSNYKSVETLQEGDKLAIGEVNSVPAGKYAQQYLKDNNLYEQVKPNLVFAKDVRQVLNYVEKGNAQLGYVYKTDLYQSQQNGESHVKEINTVDLKQPIVYKAATTSDKQLAKAWIDFLKTDEAKEILEKYQFEA